MLLLYVVNYFRVSDEKEEEKKPFVDSTVYFCPFRFCVCVMNVFE